MRADRPQGVARLRGEFLFRQPRAGGFQKRRLRRFRVDAAAAIVAWGLHRRALPCRWAEHLEGAGFCSHYDLGPRAAAFDITTDRDVWLAFAARVDKAYADFGGGPAPAWGSTACRRSRG